MANVSEWSTTAGSNNDPSPDGFPEGMAPSGVNDATREMMAAISKVYDDQRGAITTAGTSTAYTLTTNNVHAALSDIPITTFFVDETCGASPTLNIDSLGAKTLKKANNSDLVAGDLLADQLCFVAYNSTNDTFELIQQPRSSDEFVSGVIAGHKNLIVKNNAATPDDKVDIDADDVELSDGAAFEKASTVNLTIDITTSGANGLDTGARVPSTWYYLFVIFDGSTVASLASTSISSPTMPGSHTFKGLVGAIYNDASDNFITMYQRDRLAGQEPLSVLSAGASESLLSVDLSASVPIGCLSVIGNAVLLDTAGGTSAQTSELQPQATGQIGTQQHAHGNEVSNYSAGGPYEVMLIEDQEIFYSVSADGALTVNTTGYRW